VVFGGSVAYVPQMLWIRNVTLRENIMFGQKEVKDKQVVGWFWGMLWSLM